MKLNVDYRPYIGLFALALLLADGGPALAMGKGNADKANGGPPQASSNEQTDIPPKGKPYGIGGNRDEDDRKPRDRDGGLNIDIGAFFGSDTRRSVGDYYGKQGCPPGLAKKRNGCLPPGQAKKRYQLGQRLPSGVGIESLPYELRRRLGSSPDGYRYGYVDGDVLLLEAATNLVVDAIAR